jgi:hypothetical protein
VFGEGFVERGCQPIKFLSLGGWADPQQREEMSEQAHEKAQTVSPLPWNHMQVCVQYGLPCRSAIVPKQIGSMTFEASVLLLWWQC